MMRLGTTAAVLLTAIACSSGPLELANIQVGRSLNPDQSIASITTLFKPGETVYVSVQTKGGGKGTIGVKWMYEGRVIDEPSKQVNYSGPSSTEFQLTNRGGFPPGEYSVEVLIDGKSVGTRAFRVAS